MVDWQRVRYRTLVQGVVRVQPNVGGCSQVQRLNTLQDHIRSSFNAGRMRSRSFRKSVTSDFAVRR